MSILRIFVSSPGDVGEERKLAERIIKRLQHSFSGVIELEPYFWEHEPLLATSSFQPQITRPSATDIVICILWTRLGTRLPDDYVTVEGQLPPTGTEFEFEDAVTSWNEHRRPDLLVYVKKAKRLIDLVEDEEVMLESVRQKKMLDTFIERWFYDPEKGYLKKAFHIFEGLSTFEEQLENHLRKLIEQKMGAELDAAAVPAWTESPFRGLEFFDFEHAPIFFGRTKAIGDVIDAMRRQASQKLAFVCVLGMSGCGKSSLIRGGVLPLLVEPGVIEGIAVWRRAIFRPSDAEGDLFDGLAAAFLGETALPELTCDNTTAQELAAMLRKAPETAEPLIKGGLAQVVGDLCAKNLASLAGPDWTEEHRQNYIAQFKHQTQARLVLFIDQFEEIFTRDGVTPEEREQFVKAIACLSRCGRVWTITSLRSDFYSKCGDLPQLVELMRDAGQYQLLVPSVGEIGQMIVEPAAMAGLRFEKEAVTNVGLEEVLRDAAAEDRSALPLLEFTLEELYQNREQGRVLTYAAYEKIGRLEGAIANKAETTYDSLSDEGKSAFDTVFRSIVTAEVGEEDRFTRKWAPIEFLNKIPGGAEFVGKFGQERLLVSDVAAGVPSVTVSHEALLRSWPRLTKWLKENQEYLRIQTRVAQAAEHWEREKQDPDLLLAPGKPLAEAEDALKQRRAVFSGKQLAYIDVSSRAARRKAQRRRTITQVVVATMAVISCAALFFMVQSMREEATTKSALSDANTAESNEKKMETEAVADKDKAQDALKEEQMTTFSVYQTAYKAAKEQKQSGEELFWLRAAVDLGQQLGLDTRDLELALTGESSLASHLAWRSPSAVPNIRVQSFKDGTTWASFGTPGVSTSDYDSLAIGRQTPNGWSFDKSMSRIGAIGAAAPWNAGKQMLAICDHKLTEFDATTMKSGRSYPNDAGTLEDALCVTPDETSAYVSGDGKLQQVDLSSMKLMKEWPLDLPDKTKIYSILLSPANQLAIFRTFDGQNREIVLYSLKDSKTVLSLARQTMFENAIAADDKHLVFGGEDGGDNTPSELVCVDLQSLKVWRKSCPWNTSAILKLGPDDFTVVHQDGSIRHWSYDGVLGAKESMQGVDLLSNVWPVDAGYFLVHDGKIGFRTDLTKPDEVATPSAAFANAIAVNGNDDLAAADTSGKVAFTKDADGAKTDSWPLNADDLAIDAQDNRLFARKGSHLSAYDLKTRKKIATVEVETAVPLVFSPERDALLAVPATGDGLYAFDPVKLDRQERITSSVPIKIGLVDGGLWFATLNTIDQQLRVEQYSWPTASVTDPITVSCPASQVEDVDFNSGELLLGMQDGSVSIYEVKATGQGNDSSLAVDPKPRFVSPDLEKVLRIWIVDPFTACFAHEDGQLDIARVNQDGGYTLAEILHPFGTQSVAQALPIGTNTLLLRSIGGEVGRFMIASSASMSSAPDPSVNAFYTCDCDDFYAYSAGSYVKVHTSDGTELSLQGTKVTADSFDQVMTNPSRTILAATDTGGVIYLWPVNKGVVDQTGLVTLNAQPGYDYIKFLDDKTLATADGGQVCVIDIGDKLHASIRWTQTAPPQALPFKSLSGICYAQGNVITAYESANKVFVFDGKTGSCSEINVPEVPRSLCTGGVNGDKILVGGENTVDVIDLNKKAVDHQIKLPAVVEAYTYYVRSMMAVPKTDFMLFGCQKGIAYADLNRKTTFMTQPVDDYVWGMTLSQSGDTILWRGQNFYGCLPLANLSQPVPESNWLESTFAMRLEGNSRLQSVLSLDLAKDKP